MARRRAHGLLLALLAGSWCTVALEQQDQGSQPDQPARIVLPTYELEPPQQLAEASTSPRPPAGLASTKRPERAREELKERGPLEPKPVNKLQLVLLEYLQPTPLVDGLREEDKYGNDGERFNRIGRTFVDGVGALTSLLRSAVDYPTVVLKGISRRFTQALNSIGSRIVGLQRRR
ncbi:uncharacterized protein LOC134536255 isoform X2 [Bacillus rossius redtenbacheri]|uniref:uncharacterized protein LOC134536255 isoform X2 n=1 Tax=Bacillus rossius redtenbacheri TaxID=93214 RepID=UPI002FDE881D